ncbi:MAG: ABC transporter permease [Candidatus Limnocylindrales bacterium]
MEVLADIPIIGLVFQLISFLAHIITTNGAGILALATPIALGAMCGVMNERSGIVNIGIEGMMLASAFTGWFVCSVVATSFPMDPVVFGLTPAVVLGLIAALSTGMIASLVHAWLSISLKVDQIISGTIINIVAFGVTGYLHLLLSRTSTPSGGTFDTFRPPPVLTDLPVIGWLLKAVLQQGPVTMSMLVLVVVLQILLIRSRWGLRTRAVGEHPKAAETVGIDVIRLRYRNVVIGGAFAGLAGAWFTLDYGGTFETGMTNGRGFIALAALIFGRWHPVGAFLAALLFAASGTLGIAIRTSPPTGQLGDILASIPEQVFSGLPYIVTIFVLAGVVGRSIPPAAVGRPYEREATH